MTKGLRPFSGGSAIKTPKIYDPPTKLAIRRSQYNPLVNCERRRAEFERFEGFVGETNRADERAMGAFEPFFGKAK